MYKGIIFDLSDVYLRGIIGIEDTLSEIAGVEIKNEHLYNDTAIKLFKGQITEDAYWDTLIGLHNWKVDRSTLKQLIRSNMAEISGVRDIIEEIREKQTYKLGLLSVHAKEWIAYCESKYKFHHLFHTVSFSYHSGYCKPEIEAFQEILTAMNLHPQQALLVDDAEENIEIANELGMKTILFKDAEMLKSELVKRNIL